MSRQRQSPRAIAEHLQDEVYRQMFRLEADRPAADLLLAVALLRAWMALESEPPQSVSRRWLRVVCPVCIGMITERELPSGREDNGTVRHLQK